MFSQRVSHGDSKQKLGQVARLHGGGRGSRALGLTKPALAELMTMFVTLCRLAEYITQGEARLGEGGAEPENRITRGPPANRVPQNSTTAVGGDTKPEYTRRTYHSISPPSFSTPKRYCQIGVSTVAKSDTLNS